MFETAVIRARAADRRFAFLSLSFAVHAAAVAAVIAGSLTSTRLPQDAPKQMMRIYFAAPPPALGTPVEGSRPRLPGRPRAAVLHVDMAPRVIPSVAVAPATSETQSSEGEQQRQQGVPGGVPGGVGTEAPAAPDAAGPLPVGVAGVLSPVVIHRVEPVYPQIALRSRMSGSVVLQCVIDKTGHIRDGHVVNSSFGAFEQPAIDAVQQWLFSPGTLNGQPVDVLFELTVKFQVR